MLSCATGVSSGRSPSPTFASAVRARSRNSLRRWNSGTSRLPSQMLSSTDNAGARLSSCATKRDAKLLRVLGIADLDRLAVD